MYKEVVTYVDYNGVERTESHYFNLTEAEILEMEMSTAGGFAEMVQGIIDAKDQPAIIKIFKDLIFKAYGRKSPDGRLFEKSDKLSLEFSQTPAYSKLFMKYALDDKAGSAFINGLMPAELVAKANAMNKQGVAPVASIAPSIETE